MAREINVFVTSESDGTTRDAVPDWLIHMAASWIDNAGQPQQAAVDRYLLAQLSWIKDSHPARARELMEQLVYEIERVRQGLDPTL
jgi:hypothetical protein